MILEAKVALQGLLTPEQYFYVFQSSPPKLPTPEEFFDAQLAHFLSFGLGQQADYEYLRPFVPDTLDFMIRPAVPDPLHFGLRMAQMVQFDGRRGQSWIATEEAGDRISIPTGAHIMVGVDDGLYCDGRPSASLESILADRRCPFGVWDGICFASLFPCALRDRSFNLVASRCTSNAWISLALNDRRPSLMASGNHSVSDRGTPSCLQRFGVQA